MYETNYDKLQPYFDRRNLQLLYMGCDVFVLSIRTQNVIKELKNHEVLFDFSNLDKNHELFSQKIKTSSRQISNWNFQKNFDS